MNDEQVALQAYQEEWDAAEQRRRQAQEEALHAHMMATYGETVDQQAQALAQFHMSRTGSRPEPTAPSRQGTLSNPTQSSGEAAAQGGGADQVADIDERYVAAPRKPQPLPEPRKLVTYVSRLQVMRKFFWK